MRVSGKVTLSYPLYELIKKYSNSSFAQGSRQGGGRCLPGNWCSGPCYYLRRSLTFRPRVHCYVAWYNALPAHLPSKLERVQKRALRIICLWKLYNLLESLDLRTGGNWALYDLEVVGAKKNGRARGRHAETSILSCAHFFQTPATQAKNTRNGVSGGACRLTPPVAARSLSLDAYTRFWDK